MGDQKDAQDTQKEIQEWLGKLQDKYEASGQDMVSYLQGLYYADYLNYWDYINLDVLLNLQQPRTPYRDEPVFIIYHQVTELIFKLTLHELKHMENCLDWDWDTFNRSMQRLLRYFKMLTDSFSIMVEGMEPKQFRKFRMSLLPASGFQSVQYRKIEISSTAMLNLVDKKRREEFNTYTPVEELFPFIYWRYGATELATGKKTLTLRDFEGKYDQELLELAQAKTKTNLWTLFQHRDREQAAPEETKTLMRHYDLQVNVLWPMAHLRSAGRYLQKEPEILAATGGTNWQKYLPPKFQKRIFFPKLWEENEKQDWGKLKKD